MSTTSNKLAMLEAYFGYPMTSVTTSALYSLKEGETINLGDFQFTAPSEGLWEIHKQGDEWISTERTLS